MEEANCMYSVHNDSTGGDQNYKDHLMYSLGDKPTDLKTHFLENKVSLVL
jgi:hypothetical protein